MPTFHRIQRPAMLMMVLLILLSVLGNGAMVRAETILLGDTETISGTGRAIFPRIATSADATYVTWREEGRVLFRRYDHPTSTWGPTSGLSDINIGVAGVVDEPEIAVADEYVYVTWHQYTPTPELPELKGLEVYVAVSSDGGGTWSPAKQISTAPFYASWYPRIAAAGNRAFVVWSDYSPEPGLMVAAITDGQPAAPTRLNTFSAPETYDVAAALVPGASTPDVYVGWTAGRGAVLVRRSTNGGAAFDAPFQLRNDGSDTATIRLAAAGTRVYALWSSQDGQGSHLRLASSTNRGASFDATEVAAEPEAGCIMGYCHYELSINPAPESPNPLGSELVVAWVANSAAQPGMFASRSSTSGSSFSTATRLSTSGGPLSVSAWGRFVSVAWHADDVTPFTPHKYKVLLAQSSDRGDTFSPIQVSDSANLAVMPAVATSDQRFGVAWMDFRYLSTDDRFASSIVYRPASLRADYAVESVMAVQAVTDPMVTELVVGKPTGVLATIRSDFPAMTVIPVRLTYTIMQHGVAQEVVDVTSVTLQPGENRVLLPAGKTIEPDGESLQAKVEVDPTAYDAPVGHIREIDETNNVATTPSYPLVQTKPFRVLFVPVHFTGVANPGIDATAMQSFMTRTVGYVLGAYPLDPRKTGWTPYPGDPVMISNQKMPKPDYDNFQLQLNQLRLAGGYDKVVAVMPRDWFGIQFSTPDKDRSGVAGIAPYISGHNNYLGVVMVSQHAPLGKVTAHELAHNLGWVDEDIDSTAHFDRPVDGYWMKYRLRRQGMDFMQESGGSEEWIGAETFNYLLGMFAEPNSSAAPLRLATTTTTDGALALDGTIAADGTVEAGPWYRLDRDPDVLLDQQGEYTVEYQDAGGNVIARTGFNASGSYPHLPTFPQNSAFTALVPYVSGTATVVVKRDGQTLVRRSQSDNAPTVDVLPPNAGQPVGVGQVFTIRWNGSDADGDELEYIVSISTDGGETWTPISTSTTEDHLNVTATQQIVSDSALIKVTATDGLHTTSDTADEPLKVVPATIGKIAWTRTPSGSSGGASQIWTMNADGSNLRQITQFSVTAFKPTWSPNGSKIAFTGVTSAGDRASVDGLWVVNADGSNLTLIHDREKRTDPYMSWMTCPAWSPDGTRIMVQGDDGGAGAIYVMNADGTNVHKIRPYTSGLDDAGVYDTCPRWSPDGTQIVFDDMRPRDPSDIVRRFDLSVMNADGTNQRVIASDIGPSAFAAWSPNGKQIVFRRTYRGSDQLSYVDLFLVNPDGTDERKLTQNTTGTDHTADMDTTVAWSPDSTQIVSSFKPRGVYVDHLWLTDAQTGERIRQLTTDPALRDLDPAWINLVNALPEQQQEVVAVAGGPYTGYEGATVQLDARKSSALHGIAGYDWDLDNDGEYDDAQGATTTLKLLNEGTYGVGVQVTDNQGTTSTAFGTVIVKNAAPRIITTATTATRDARGTTTLSAQFTDSGRQDTHTAIVDWGDGTAPEPAMVTSGTRTNSVNATHRYNDAASYEITITVTDDAGDAHSAKTSVVTATPNRAPYISEGGAFTKQGVPVSIRLQAVDPDGNMLRYSVVTQPQHGRVEVVPNQSPLQFDAMQLIYFPDPAYKYGGDQLTVQATDGLAVSNVAKVHLFVEPVMRPVTNRPPVASAGEDRTVAEGSQVTLDARGSTDPDGDTLAYTWEVVGSSNGAAPVTLSDPQAPQPSFGTTDNGVYTFRVTAVDGKGGSSTDEVTITVTNVAPSVGPITAPAEPLALNTAVTTSAPFTDPGSADTHTAVWEWGDGTTGAGVVDAGSVAGSHTYTTPGVYTVKLTVTDDDGGAAPAMYQYVVVYDPSGGFVTGGGWIDSPAGACKLTSGCESVTGKANFGFVSRYQKGAAVPTGQTQFEFHAGSLTFHSTAYEWLVVAGPKAQYKGAGTINGRGDYGFLLTANDGQAHGGGAVDRFRIKIWDKASGAVVYDNQLGAGDDAPAADAIEGGSIVIHGG